MHLKSLPLHAPYICMRVYVYVQNETKARRDGIGSMSYMKSHDKVTSDMDMVKLLRALKIVQGQDIDVLRELLLSGENVSSVQDKSIKWTENFDLERKYSVLETERNEIKNELVKLLTEKRIRDGELVKNSNKWTESAELERKYSLLEAERNHLKNELEKFLMKKKTRDHELETVTDKLKEADEESRNQKLEILRLKQITDSQALEIKQWRQEIADLKEELKSMERKLQEQRRARDEAEKAKEDAMRRLSRQMGQQMSEGNPNITDLSDQNRPSKLGERYSELYDNEWTNAFEVLTTKFHLEDKKAIETLQTIVHVGPECTRLLKEACKHVDISKADDLFKCFQLCWLMSIQDPQVVFAKNPDHGDHFDTNMYKHYTISGDEVDYVVWPALLLHEKGPFLVKGVAQPIPRSKRRVKSAPIADRFKDRTDLTLQEGSVRNMKSASCKARQNRGIDDHGSAMEDCYDQSSTRTDATLYRWSASTTDKTRLREKSDATFLQE
ncbi:hypothetical protein CHS0354_026357 [Potamilus streckersoni]|uniref:Mitochondria-eating protein C-terminal domain-containing protein n=1 Tax=Potamilus streckersoni TaxID=2493646 RepID=A0AAE0W605_9BIVA|nr:hypothetical protein CHS0354_026357 [Potamilus streckersoni]